MIILSTNHFKIDPSPSRPEDCKRCEGEGGKKSCDIAVQEDNDDTKYYWLLVFPSTHMLKFAQLQ